jgi:hypothetical protein
VCYGPGGPFSYGPPGPSPHGSDGHLYREKLANACVKVPIGSAQEAQGPMCVCQQQDLATKKGVETLPRRVKNLPHSNIRCSRALRMGLMAHFYFILTFE